MEKFQQVLLRVWREACRHIEIDQSTRTIATLLADDLPLAAVFVRRIHAERACLETVAAEQHDQRQTLGDGWRGCASAEIERLVEWCRQGEVVLCAATEPLPQSLRPAVPDEFPSDVLIGPLGDDDGTTGLLVFVAQPGKHFSGRHRALMGVLLEPFSVALDNDSRLREMAALREAAEADKRSLLTRLGRKKLGGDTIVGAQQGLRAVMQRVELVARSDAPVLLFGETGTGKEVVARAIHTRSARENGPIQRVNCGAIPPELIDAQLFGHEKGAFTGAEQTRKGWFERADGGTLFLDEIGELPPPAQVRLLRILQDGWLERVGGQQPLRVDVRIVAATHRDLAGMVAEGRFREDLWYRLAVFPIVLPPLRERQEDIPALAEHFSQRAATRFGLAPVSPTPDDMALLTAYDWPGNVRELGAVIDRAAILGEGQRLDVAAALGVQPPSRRPTAGAWRESAEQASPVLGGSTEELPTLDDAMRRHIEAALHRSRGRIEGPYGAAQMLAINPHTLRARMRKLDIRWQRFRSE